MVSELILNIRKPSELICPCETVDDFLQESLGINHRTIVTWARLSLWLSETSQTGSRGRGANQECLEEGTSVFMYAPVSSLNLLSSMAYVCVCLHLLSSVCVYKCVCAASARHSSLTLAAAAGSDVWAAIAAGLVLSAPLRAEVERLKPAFQQRSGSLVEAGLSQRPQRKMNVCYGRDDWLVLSPYSRKVHRLNQTEGSLHVADRFSLVSFHCPQEWKLQFFLHSDSLIHWCWVYYSFLLLFYYYFFFYIMYLSYNTECSLELEKTKLTRGQQQLPSALVWQDPNSVRPEKAGFY